MFHLVQKMQKNLPFTFTSAFRDLIMNVFSVGMVDTCEVILKEGNY